MLSMGQLPLTINGGKEPFRQLPGMVPDPSLSLGVGGPNVYHPLNNMSQGINQNAIDHANINARFKRPDGSIDINRWNHYVRNNVATNPALRYIDHRTGQYSQQHPMFDGIHGDTTSGREIGGFGTLPLPMGWNSYGGVHTLPLPISGSGSQSYNTLPLPIGSRPTIRDTMGGGYGGFGGS